MTGRPISHGMILGGRPISQSAAVGYREYTKINRAGLTMVDKALLPVPLL